MEAPVDMHPATDARAHHAAEGAEHVETSVKPEGMMSKVKRKAKKLRDKVKKATGPNSSDNDHGYINRRDQEDVVHKRAPGADDEGVDEEIESFEDDVEEEHGHISPADKQLKYQQLRSIGALDNQEDGSEVEVHGGIPVSALADTPDTHGKSAADDVPISPYKSAGPPDTLQATPTEYRNYAADNDPLLQLGGEGKTTIDTSNVNVDRTSDSQGLPTFSEVKTATSPEELHVDVGISGKSAVSDMDVAYPEDIVKPNTEFGHSSSTTYDKIGVMTEDLSTDRKLGVGHTSEHSCGRGKENLTEISVPEFAELSGYAQSSAPASVEADELVYRPVSDPDEGSFPTHPPGMLDGVVHEIKEIAQAAETGQTIDNNAPAFLNDHEYPSTRGAEKPIFDSADGVKSLSLVLPPQGEAAEPEKDQYESGSKRSADKPAKVKDDGSFPTSSPGTLDGAICEPNAVAGESLGNRTSAFAKETDGPSISVEEKRISDTAHGIENLSLEQSAPGGNNNAIDAVGMSEYGGDRAPNLKDDEYVDALSKPRVSEAIRKDVDDDEFYDPNDVNNSQFQEGFAFGSGDAEEDAINSTLPGSAVGKLQALKERVASTLGYGNVSSPRTEGGGNGEENPLREDVNFSPTQQQTGMVKGWKDTVASTFGYGKELADEALHRDKDMQSRVAEREYIPEAGIDGGQHQTGGALQGLKNVVASKLGYGTGGESPSENTRTHNTPVEDVQPRYDDGGEHGVGGKAEYVSGHDVHIEGEPHEQQQTGVLQGMKNMVSSKFGYNGSEGPHTAETGHMTQDEVPAVSCEERAGDNHQADSYTQKLFNATAAASDYFSSKIGYGNSNQDKDDRNLTYAGEGEKPIDPLNHADNNYDAEERQRV